MNSSAEISLYQLLLGTAPIVVALVLSRCNHLGLEKALSVGFVRASVQLSITGYILLWVFSLQNKWLIIGILLFMVSAAAQAGAKRLKAEALLRRRLQVIIFASVLAGSLLTLFYVQFVVIRPDILWDGRYLVALGGMIISNAMNASVLAAERFRSELVSRTAEIETYLSLGASSRQAAATAVRIACSAAMMPSINSLAVLGLVSLPGMMSGQILSGVSPLLAVRYQLIVVFMICGASAITSWLVIELSRRLYFTKNEQFVRP